jgi:hypothetical protein
MTRVVQVTMDVEVTVDEGKFTPEFMQEFRESFYRFVNVEDHISHLAQLTARGEMVGWPDEFVEGYGRLEEMGIKARIVPRSLATEVV